MSRVALYSLVAILASAGSIHAQAVQLPTFQFFGASTTVSVPDHGTAFMGGNSTAYSSSNSRGTPLLGPAGPLFNNRGIANGGTTSNISVTAQIHDMDAMDRALLGGMSADEFRRQVRNGGGSPGGSSSRLTLGPATPGVRGSVPTSAGSYGEQELAAQLKRQKQAEEQLALGQAMAGRGKVSLAQSYYRMALNNANGELRNEVLRAQAELSNTAATPVTERK